MDQSKDLGGQHTNVIIPDQNDVQANSVMVGFGTKDSKNRFKPNKWMAIAAFALLFGGIGSYLLFGSKAAVIPNGDIFVQSLGADQQYITKDGMGIAGKQDFPADAWQTSSGNQVLSPTTVSPDGSVVAYYADSGKKIKIIRSVDQALLNEVTVSEEHKNINSSHAFRWSPDNTKLSVRYYNSSQESASYIVSIDGVVLAELPRYSDIIGWGVTGDRVFYYFDKQICEYNITSDTPSCSTLRPKNNLTALWSANESDMALDGMRVALFSRDTAFGGVYIFGLDGEQQKFIPIPGADKTSLGSMSWSPDGTKIALATGAPDTDCMKLCLVDIETGSVGESLLTQTTYPSQVVNLNWVSKEHKSALAFEAPGQPIVHKNGTLYDYSAQVDYQGLGLSSSAGGNSLVSTRPLFDPIDGKKVYYLADRKRVNGSYNVNDAFMEPARLMTKAPNGSFARQLVELPDSSANWIMDDISPDGRWILMRKTIAPGLSWGNAAPYDEIWIVRSDGTSLQKSFSRLSNDTSYGYVYGYPTVWGSDSRTLYYMTGGRPSALTAQEYTKVSYCSIDVTGANGRCTDIVGETGSPGNIAVSPNGKTLLYDLVDTYKQTTTLYTTTIGSNNQTKLKTITNSWTPLATPSWSPDGTKIVFGAPKNTMIDSNGANEKTFTTLGGTNSSFVWQPLPDTVKRAAYDKNGDGVADFWDQRNFAYGYGMPYPADYGSTGVGQYAVWRPLNGTWNFDTTSSGIGTSSRTYGMKGDVPVPADYTGDGKADTAVWRPSNLTWYVYGGVPTATVCGAMGDIPVPADYNGDGKADFAVYRPSNRTFYVCGGASLAYGNTGDIPVPADYNGDGKADFAVFRPSTAMFYVNSGASAQVGPVGSIPIPADYNGDGRTDMAIVSALKDASGMYSVQFADGAILKLPFQPLNLPYPQARAFSGYQGAILTGFTDSSMPYNIPSAIAVRTSSSTGLYNVPEAYGGMKPDGTNTVVMSSPKGMYMLKFWKGGLYLINSVSKKAIYLNTQPSTTTAATALTLKTDGNLVFYRKTLASDPWSTAWQSNTVSKGATKLLLEDTGNLVLRNSANTAIWSSNTAGKY